MMYFEQLWNEYSKLPMVEALVLGGSRAGENYDEKSDYDFYVYVNELPSEEQRKSILEKCCKYMEISNSFWELEDDCILKDDIPIDILYRNMNDFENQVASVVEGKMAYTGYTTCMWHNVVNSKILYDPNGKFEKMQKRFSIPYPAELKKNIIEKNMKLLTGMLPSYDDQIKKAVKRGDLVSINHRTSAFMESYFDVIFALNEMTHPGEKRMVQYASMGKIIPQDFEDNIKNLYANLFTDTEKAMHILDKMIENIKSII